MSPPARNSSIAPQARAVVAELDRFAARADVAAALGHAQAQGRERLAGDANLGEAFVALDLAPFGPAVPAALGSVRVVVTRGEGGHEIERHANSTQYLMAQGDPVRTHVLADDGRWRIDAYGHGDAAQLENRWHVVPPGVWHRSDSPGAQVWAIAAFHSAREVGDEYAHA